MDIRLPLDCVDFQIFLEQNRYVAYIHCEGITEELTSGILDHLLVHLSKAKEVSVYKLQLPDNLKSSSWFTKTTLSRFLTIVNAPELFKAANVIKDEMSQLEEAIKFHLDLYAQEHRILYANGTSDIYSVRGMDSTQNPDILKSSDPTKNDLLRAMNMRLMSSREELVLSFNKAVGGTCPPQEIPDLISFAQYFGASTLRDFLMKYLSLTQEDQGCNNISKLPNILEIAPNDPKSTTKIIFPQNLTMEVDESSTPSTKDAQEECQTLAESKNSTDSEKEDITYTERSRPIIRSASPRRSASPMRRIQIGRCGSRKAQAITIKNLGYVPVREKIPFSRETDGSSSEDEEPDKQPQKSDKSVRMSVQDAINLFESKQKNQLSDVPKSFVTNKSVLRRWSASISDTSIQSKPETTCQGDTQANNHKDENPPPHQNSVEFKTKTDSFTSDHSHSLTKEHEEDAQLPQEESSRRESIVGKAEDAEDHLTSAAEWNRQKEAELNEILLKITESKPIRYNTDATRNRKNVKIPSEKKSYFYDHYKEKRDEKLRGENAGKCAEKQGQDKATQEHINQKKVEMVSKRVIGSRKITSPPSLKPHRNSSSPLNLKCENSMSISIGKAAVKKSSPPAIRKSWPSTPSPKTTSQSPSKVSSGSTNISHQKSQSTVISSQPSPKTRSAQQSRKGVKGSQMKNDNITRKQEKPQVGAKTNINKPTKTKVPPSPGEQLAKPSFYNKVTKKGSVVPLESKPFLRKGTGRGPAIGSNSVKIKASESKVTARIDENQSERQEKPTINSDKILTNPGDENSIPTPEDISSNEVCENSQFCEIASAIKVNEPPEHADAFEEEIEVPNEVQPEEHSISPIAWVEEDCPELPQPQQSLIECDVIPRVRHSLSQMLQAESGESEIIEWGNAENPPSMVYQKDAPKGFKRLLKFARKSKVDANGTNLSNHSVFSEGEEDPEDSKTRGRKVSFQSKCSSMQQKGELGEFFETGNSSKRVAELSSQQFPTVKINMNSTSLSSSHLSGSGASTRVSRSFFSLPNFRSSK